MSIGSFFCERRTRRGREIMERTAQYAILARTPSSSGGSTAATGGAQARPAMREIAYWRVRVGVCGGKIDKNARVQPSLRRTCDTVADEPPVHASENSTQFSPIRCLLTI